MHFREHFTTVQRHRRLVRKYCFKLGLYRQGLLHDLSKLSPVEFLRGAKYYQGYRSPNDQERMETGHSLAWLHHKGRNKHHHEYWIDYVRRPDGTVFNGGSKMPIRYVAEQVCDRMAACRIYQGEKYTDASAYNYFIHGKPVILIHPDTSDLLERWLGYIKDLGEDAGFKRIKEELNDPHFVY